METDFRNLAYRKQLRRRSGTLNRSIKPLGDSSGILVVWAQPPPASVFFVMQR